jgi:hypothetical protein
MDILVLILILLSGYIIKYLIDTINLLNNEIKEIKMKYVIVPVLFYAYAALWLYVIYPYLMTFV